MKKLTNWVWEIFPSFPWSKAVSDWRIKTSSPLYALIICSRMSLLSSIPDFVTIFLIAESIVKISIDPLPLVSSSMKSSFMSLIEVLLRFKFIRALLNSDFERVCLFDDKFSKYLKVSICLEVIAFSISSIYSLNFIRPSSWALPPILVPVYLFLNSWIAIARAVLII